MTRTTPYTLAGLSFAAMFLFGGCVGGVDGTPGSSSGTGGNPGSAGGSVDPTTGAGGATTTTGAGGTTTTTGAGGTTTTTGAGGTTVTGGGGAGGTGGRGGGSVTTGAGGTSNPTGAGGSGPTTPLDCGPMGVAIENAGPPANRVNYVILGDGFTAETVNTTFMTDIQAVMARRFAPTGQPYLRYRKFVNICGLKIISANNGAQAGTPAAAGPTAFNCGEYQPGTNSRLASCNTAAAMTAQTMNLPASFQVDWHSIMLNNSEWWNSGGAWMLFSGGNVDGPGAALHEGGHGFHQLADEYGTCTGANCGSNTMGTGAAGTTYGEVNSAGNAMTTDGKWDLWIGFTQLGATGLQGTWLGSRYVGTGQFRPSANSMMNSLFCNAPRTDPTACNPNTGFNSTSVEKMIMDIWRNVVPVDSAVPPAGAVSNPAMLQVNVIDPAVINVDWSVDGAVVAANGGPTFMVGGRGLSSGSHTIAARAYDNAGMDLVRYRNGGTTFGRMNWARSQQTVTWTVTIP